MNFLTEKRLIKNEGDVKKAVKAALKKGAIPACRGNWETVRITKARSETGWDIVFKRNNGRQFLAIEAKYAKNKSRASRFEPALAAILIRKNPKCRHSKKEISNQKVYYGIAFNKFDKDDIQKDFSKFIRKRINKTERGKLAWEKLFDLGARYIFLVNDFTKEVEFYRWKDFLN